MAIPLWENQASVPFHMGNWDQRSKSQVCRCLFSFATQAQGEEGTGQLCDAQTERSFLETLPAPFKQELGANVAVRDGSQRSGAEADADPGIPVCLFPQPKARPNVPF